MHVRRTCLMAAGLALSTTLVGCGSSSTSPSVAVTTPSSSPSSAHNPALDSVVASANKQVQGMMTRFAGVYSNIVVAASGSNTLVITYTFVKHIDPATGGARILTQGPILDAACKTDFYPSMKAAGVTNPAARYVWDNPDGTEVTHYDCK